MPQVEVVTIGTELLLGHVVDTNSTHLAKQLADTGIRLSHVTAVGDDLDRIVEVLQIGMTRSDVIITTGGLGPTEDDLTRDAIAAATGRKLIFKNELMEEIEGFFKTRGLRMAPNNRKQACIPRGALPIRNPVGTAPGFIVEDRRGVIISLPGVPRELEHLIGSVVIPYLRKRYRLGRQVILTKVLRVSGLGESGVDKEIGDVIRTSQNPRIGLLASPGDIKICIVSRARSQKEAMTFIDPVEKEIRNRLNTLIYGVDNETLEDKVVEYLTQLNLHLSVADTFTGGVVCQRILKTGTPRLVQAFILPSKKGQMAFLRLRSRAFSTLVRDQESYCIALARQALEHADVGLGITGDFKTSNGKLIGNLAVSVVQGTEDHSKSWRIGGSLDGMAERASIIALDMLRRYLLGKTPHNG